MVTVGAVGIIAIAVASFFYLGKQEQRFLGRLDGTMLQEFVFHDAEGDTVQVRPERTTVMLFWATWSERSLDSLYDLYKWHDNYPQYEIIAAYVKDAPEFARAHDRAEQENHRLLDGTPAYQDLRVPGVPTAIIFDESGTVRSTEIGARAVPAWHELSTRGELQSGMIP